MPNIDYLEKTANLLRSRIIERSHATHTPHLGSCLSCVDILTVLYFHVLRVDAKNPYERDRDRFILSKGHAAPALFQTLALKGYFPENAYETVHTMEQMYLENTHQRLRI